MRAGDFVAVRLAGCGAVTDLRERIAEALTVRDGATYAAVRCPDPRLVDAVMVEVQRDLDELRAALVECAAWAGEDVSDGPPTSGLCEWAVTAVREHREDSDADARHYVARAEAAEADAARLAEALEWACPVSYDRRPERVATALAAHREREKEASDD